MPKKKEQPKSLFTQVKANKWVLAFLIIAAISGGLYAIQRSHAGGCGDGYTIEWESGYIEYVPETQGCGYGGYDPDTDTFSGTDDGGQTWTSSPADDSNRPLGAQEDFDYSSCQCGGDPYADTGADWWLDDHYLYDW